MAIDQESFNKRLYDLLKTRGYKPVSKNSNNESIPHPQDADIFEFNFTKDDEDYGKVWATINKANSLEIYYGDTVAGSPPGTTPGVAYDDSWTGLLKQLKQWALSKQLSFELKDMSNIGDDMKQRKWHDMKERTNESYHAVNKTTSYNDNIPNVKVIIQHDRQIGEGEQRWRNVHKIFVENTEGERFAVPTRMPGIARVYGRHVAEGGTPYDDRGKHITTLVEEYTKMAGFVRATRNGQFNESVAQLIAEGINHHRALKESLQRMQSHRGYDAYFESWTPPLMEDESDSSSIAEMFAQGTIDPRIESVLPILNRLNSGIINEIEEVNELEQWAKGITEITEDAEERPYICYHTKKGKHECTASSSYGAAQKAADHWGLKSTAGIDAKLADVEHSPASLEEDSGCACGCGPKSKCTCDASCPKCDCGKDKLEENPLLGMAARAVVGSAVKGAVIGALSGDDKEELDEDPEDNKSNAEAEGIAEAKEFLQKMSKRYAGSRRGIIDEVKDRLKDIRRELTQLSDANAVTKIKAEEQVYNRYISDSNFDFQSPDPLSQAQRQSHATVGDNDQKMSTRDMEKRVMGTLAGPGAIAAALRLVGPDAYSKKSTPKKYGSHKVAEDDSIDKAVDTKYGVISYPDTAISYIKNNGKGWVHIYDRSYGFEGKVDKEDLKYAKSISKEKMPSRLHEDDSIEEHRGRHRGHVVTGFTDKEIKMAYGIANDPRYKDGNMAGAIKAIEGIKIGLSDHPSVKKVIEKTQGLQETKSGGQTFAGDYKTGPAGQWRNTGPTKGRPAKVGDLVGAESIGDDTYSTGDTVTLRNGSFWTLEVDRNDGTIWATDEDGHEVELDEIIGQIVDHGKPEDRKDHSPDNMPDEIIDEGFWDVFKSKFKSKPKPEPETEIDDKFENAMAAYDAHGEEGLANALGMSLDEFDQELNEYGMEHGLHADDDRDTIIQGMVEQMIDDEHQMADMRRLSGLEEAGKPTTNSKHSSERDLKQYDPTHGHSKPEGGNPDVCKECHGAGCTQCDDGQVITPKRKDPKVDEAENSPDGNVGADDDGANDKYNQDAETVADRKSIQEDEDLLDIIRSIKL